MPTFPICGAGALLLDRRRLRTLSLAVLLATSAAMGLPSVAEAATFVVTSTADPGDGACNGTCTLREALVAANLTSTPDTVHFAFAGTGPHVITLASPSAGGGPLPPIVYPMTLDGRSEPDWSSGAPAVVLGGASAGLAADGLQIAADDTTVWGLVINGFSGNGISVVGGSGSHLYGNFIGTDASGTGAVPNALAGVAISAPASDVSVGDNVSAVNVISGNVQEGVLVDRARAVTLYDNLIGLDKLGQARLGNHGPGIKLISAPNAVVGEAYPYIGSPHANTVSANGDGIVVTTANGQQADGVVISGNRIGVDRLSANALGNTGDGVRVENASGVIVWSNTIAASDGAGVRLTGTGTTGAVISYNAIGGYESFGNDGHGVIVESGASVNRIGAGISETQEYALVGNPGGNLISFNGGSGVTIASGRGNVVRANRIHANGGLGLDLAGDGVTPNDTGDTDAGPNGLLNAPGVSDYFGPTVLDSRPNRTYVVDFFRARACDASGYGEGDEWAESRFVTTDSTGHVSFSPPLFSSMTRGEGVTATATDVVTGNTSEFSECWPIKEADLSLVAGVSAEDVIVGREVTYTITVSNGGPDSAPGLLITFPVPSTGEVTSIVTSAGKCRMDRALIGCKEIELAVGGSVEVSISVRPQSPRFSSARVGTGFRGYDPQVSNNFVQVAVNATCTITGTPGNDRLNGTPEADVICGEAGDDVLYGLGGNDILIGGRGSDRLRGGDGFDYASFADARLGVRADLATRSSSGWGRDSLESIRGLIGSRYSDVLTGDGGRNVFKGLDNEDRVYGRAGRDEAFLWDGHRDFFDGGAGTDVAHVGTEGDRVVSAVRRP